MCVSQAPTDEITKAEGKLLPSGYTPCELVPKTGGQLVLQEEDRAAPFAMHSLILHPSSPANWEAGAAVLADCLYLNFLCLCDKQDSLIVQLVKNPPAMQETLV